MEGHGEKFSRKQEQAISALLNEPTIEVAAKRIGVGQTTLWRWLQIPSFQEQYRHAKRRVVEHAITQLQNACGEAVACLREVMGDREATDSSRVSAARAVLEQSIKTVELDDLNGRIAALESILEHKEREA